MINSKVLQLLKCPVSKSQLKLATTELVEWINQRIQNHACESSNGELVENLIDNALVNENQSYAAPIRAGVISVSEGSLIKIQDYSG